MCTQYAPESMRKPPVLALAMGLDHLQAPPALAKALPCLLLSHGHRPPAIGRMLSHTETHACPAGCLYSVSTLAYKVHVSGVRSRNHDSL